MMWRKVSLFKIVTIHETSNLSFFPGCCLDIATPGFLEAYEEGFAMSFDRLQGERQNYVASIQWMEVIKELCLVKNYELFLRFYI